MATIFIQTTDEGLDEIKRDLRVTQKEYDEAMTLQGATQEKMPPHVWAILRARVILGISNTKADVIRPE
jgi:hypothetical protein